MIFDADKSILRATGRGGPWKSRPFWALKWRVPFGPKKIFRAPFQWPQLWICPHQNHKVQAPYNKTDILVILCTQVLYYVFCTYFVTVLYVVGGRNRTAKGQDFENEVISRGAKTSLIPKMSRMRRRAILTLSRRHVDLPLHVFIFLIMLVSV